MGLERKISQGIMDAMKTKDAVRLSVLRNIKTNIIEAKTSGASIAELPDASVVKIISELAKQGMESATLYTTHNRSDLAEEQLAQVAVMQEFLPKQLSDTELTEVVSAEIIETGATSMKNMDREVGCVSGKQIQATAHNTEHDPLSISPGEIKTVEDMENYLEMLSEHSNESVGAALKAQLQVIRYVQSPKLYDSSFDLLFKNIKNALKYADSPKMRETIQERASIMIQNYVFFMDAKLQFEIKVNRKEEHKIMEDASKMLAESAADVATLAIQGGSAAKKTMKKALLQATSTMLKTKDNDGDSFFSKIVRWWRQDSITNEKRGEFLQTMDMLIAKLSKQKNVIGKSDLIAGLISRYTDDMVDYFSGSAVTVIDISLNEIKRKTAVNIRIFTILILFINIGILFLRWAFKGIASWFSEADTTHWALRQWGYAFAILVAILIIISINYFYKRKQLEAQLAVAIQERDDLKQAYSNIAAEFEE